MPDMVDFYILMVDWYTTWASISRARNLSACRRIGETHRRDHDRAVTEAVRERLDRLRREPDGRLADRLLTIGKDCAARLKEPFRSADHADLLYDERGMPR